MNQTEMARLSVEQKNAQRLSGQGTARMDQLLEGQLDRVEAVTQELAPIAESVRVLCREAKDTLSDFQAASRDVRMCVEGAISQAREAAAVIERRSQHLTFKLWVWMLAVNVVVAAVIVSSYSLWQQHSAGDKEAATRWRELTRQFQGLTPARQKQINQLLYGTPSR
jgi:hypothetical protein